MKKPTTINFSNFQKSGILKAILMLLNVFSSIWNEFNQKSISKAIVAL
jgi:hypothetical protein